MNRRRLLLFFAGSAVLARPPLVKAQQAGKPRFRIGYIGTSDAKRLGPNVNAFRQGLRDLGWIEGEKISIEYRWAEGKIERFPALAAELVQMKVDAIVTAGAPALRAVQEATSTIPIIMAALLIDPVEAGFVASLARPGGNITGLSSQYEEIVTKQVQLLVEVLPKLSRLMLLRHARASPVTEKAAAAAAERLGIRTHGAVLAEVADFERAFRTARDAGTQALLVLPSPIFSAHRRDLIKLAASYRLPACYEFKEYTQDGGLISYGPNLPDMHRRAASYVDRILKGAKPGDLPIERADKFELSVNLATAKALGVGIPMSLLTRADSVIE